jgi:hypothetical protein
MNSGGPRMMKRSVKASTTSVELSLRLTLIASASLVNSLTAFAAQKPAGQRVSSEFFRQHDHVLSQPFLIRQATWHLALHGAMLAERAADPALAVHWA